MDIAVLNYSDSSIHHIHSKKKLTDEEVQELLDKKFKLDCIEWMYSENIEYYESNM